MRYTEKEIEEAYNIFAIEDHKFLFAYLQGATIQQRFDEESVIGVPYQISKAPCFFNSYDPEVEWIIVNEDVKELVDQTTQGIIDDTQPHVWEIPASTKIEEIVEKPRTLKNPNSKYYELWDGFESIDVLKQLLSDDEYKGFLKGNILKYQLRLGKKDNIEKEQTKILDYRSELDRILHKEENIC